MAKPALEIRSDRLGVVGRDFALVGKSFGTSDLTSPIADRVIRGKWDTVSPVRRVKLVDIVASEAGTTRCANIC